MLKSAVRPPLQECRKFGNQADGIAFLRMLILRAWYKVAIVPVAYEVFKAVRHDSADWHFWRRAVALTAAYAIALASIVASLGVARAAVETAAAPNAIICHAVVTGDEAPSPASNQSNHCADNCCIGCLMLLALLPPAPAQAVSAPLLGSHRVVRLQSVVLFGDRRNKSHQSRAPPLPA